MENKNTKELVEFKTSPEYFKKEESGIKPNTCRNIEIQDKRFQLLIWMMINKSYGKIKIKSIHSQVFIRQIKDISVWGNIMIISWKHEQSKGELNK